MFDRKLAAHEELWNILRNSREIPFALGSHEHSSPLKPVELKRELPRIVTSKPFFSRVTQTPIAYSKLFFQPKSVKFKKTQKETEGKERERKTLKLLKSEQESLRNIVRERLSPPTATRLAVGDVFSWRCYYSSIHRDAIAL